MADEETDRGTGSAPSRFSRATLLKDAVTSGTAVGLITYVVLRMDYALFYRRFGLKPEDVGLGQAELISQSLFGVLLFLVVFLLFLVFMTFWLAFMWIVLKLFGQAVRQVWSTFKRADIAEPEDAGEEAGTLGPGSEVPPGTRLMSRRRAALAVVAAAAVLVTEVVLALSAVSDANAVRSGHAVQPALSGLPFVSWGAQHATIAWVGSSPPGLEDLTQHCLLYLGQGAGATYLFDHDSGSTLRVSSGSVVLSIQPADDYELVCAG